MSATNHNSNGAEVQAPSEGTRDAPRKNVGGGVMTPAEGPGSNPGRTTNFIHPIHPAAEFAAMSLRDHFAAQAMTAIVAQAGAILQHFMFNPEATKDWPEEAIKAMADQSAYARRAYEIADAMLAARANGGAK